MEFVCRFDRLASTHRTLHRVAIQFEHTLERPGKPLPIARDENELVALVTRDHIACGSEEEWGCTAIETTSQRKHSDLALHPKAGCAAPHFSPTEGHA